MSNIRPSNLPIEETDLIGFVHTDRGIDGSAKFNLANVSSALNLDGMATQAPSNVAITGGAIDGTTIGATTPSTIAGTTGAFTSDTAGTILGVRNPAAGATKYTRFSLGNDSSATIAELYTFSSTYTPSAWEKPSGMGVFSSGSGGLSLVSQSGDVRILAGSLSTVHGLFTSTGLNSTAIGATTPSTGAFTSLTSTSGAFNGTVGATTPSTVAATTLTTSGTATFSGNVAVGSNAVTISTGGNVTAIDTVQVNSGTIRTALTYDTGVAVIGSYTNHPVSLRVNQTQVGQLTTTGLNSTAIGATTPSTGAFTTVTATGAADTIIGSESGTGSGTGGGVIAATASANGNASFGWRTNGVNRWVMDTVGTSDSESVRIRKLGTGAASVATFSSTGLAVTGALSATGKRR
jgi:hypothetical protein